mmetsp:Transcript_16434/g.49230  ORF Transcript_16434/g.49230 Transcript_16434/m.49230 type:complete len:254 (+) Transcript_16434:128-889(+)|eukprot:CAMPEP_0206149978 /NCGR_PEP_ID=MMETSP1473-20131121/38063_1 /ASSEMBLY_ACC=CAM_ASM_001109 /TAXON_ID=1461547 /ORGANISM="Stichococcus sp, Strain RCC1054" /LENGTH=253 /DNA_ID=CAMNT_0053547465 /DNA_START=489 /DNA_END=1250 /DNA_ORIENTATION=-
MAAPGGEPASILVLQPLPESAPVGGQRVDGRSLENARDILLRTGLVSQAAGSSYVEFGDTKVMAAVYGPRPTDRREGFSQRGFLTVDVKLASFATRERGRVQQGPAEREMSEAVGTALRAAVLREHFPKAAVDVWVTVLEADGSEAAAATTAGALALADAGVPMRDLVAACSLARMEGGAVVVDPCGAEQAQQTASAMLAVMPSADLVTGAELQGQWTSQEAREAVVLALGGCRELAEAMQETLQEAAAEAAQ